MTGKVFGTLSTEQKASEIGQADLDYGDPAQVNKHFDDIARVTAQDVQRVAKKYFAPERRSMFQMLPESMRAAPHRASGTNKEAKP